MAWLRVDENMPDDPKWLSLTSVEKLLWVELLCRAGQERSRGNTPGVLGPYPVRVFRTWFARGVKTMERVFAHLEALDMATLEIDDATGDWTINVIHFAERQFVERTSDERTPYGGERRKPSDDPALVRQRVAASRERKRETVPTSEAASDVTPQECLCNADVSPSEAQCNAPESPNVTPSSRARFPLTDSRLQTPDNNNSVTPPDRVTEAAEDAVAVAVAGELVEAGVAEKTARDLAAAFPEERIREQLALLPQRNAKRNLVGVLVQSIRENWPPPRAQTGGTASGAIGGPSFADLERQIAATSKELNLAERFGLAP